MVSRCTRSEELEMEKNGANWVPSRAREVNLTL